MEARWFEEAVQVDDEVAHVGVVDRCLRLAAPGALGAVVIGKDADDVDLGGIAEFVGVEVFQFAALLQMQQLSSFMGRGVVFRHIVNSLADARFSGAKVGSAPGVRRGFAPGKYEKAPTRPLLDASKSHAARSPNAARAALTTAGARSAPHASKTPWRMLCLL